MKIRSKVFFLSAIFFALSFTAHAQDTGGLRGKVRTVDGDGIASASVTARQDGKDIKSTTADADGNFVLEGLPPGNYNLLFAKNGYGDAVLYNVEVKKKKTRDLGGRLIMTVDRGTQAIIKGSVFAQDGRSLGRAEIKIERIAADGSAKRVGSGVSSYSGEFTFRFSDTSQAKYRVTASMDDQSASKEVEVDGAAIYRLAITLNAKRN